MENDTNINIKPILGWTVGIFLLTVVVSVYAWFALPVGAQIATHWGLDGTPNGWASKTSGLASIPLLELFLMGLYLFSLKFMPRRQNIARSVGPITKVMLVSLVIILGVQLLIIANAMGTKVDVSACSQILVGIIYIVVGNYLGKIRSNFMTGIRTPWTLSSELSWDKTNRLAGKLFVTAGIILIAGKWMNDMLMWVGLLTVETIIITIVSAIYSYKIWQIDPSKHAEIITDQEDTELLIKTRLREGMITKTTIMLLIAAFLIIWTIGRANKPSPELVNIATVFVQNVSAAKYAEAEIKFADVMKNALPPDKLQEAWKSAEAKYGTFVNQTNIRSSSIWPYKMIVVNCKFERSQVLVKVVFSNDGKISGLWFSPG